MELTECIRGKIEQMRQKKLLRHQQASTQTEQMITQLTARRSQLFETLENEVQKRIGPTHKSEIAESSLTRPLADHKSADEPVSDMLEEKNNESDGSDNDENHTRLLDVHKLREEAAHTDKCLQRERSYLSELRIALASSLARLDQLEADLCKHSETWETEEKERLSIESSPEISLKRKRLEESLSSGGAQTKKVMLRAMETIAVLGLGAGIDAARRAYM